MSTLAVQIQKRMTLAQNGKLLIAHAPMIHYVPQRPMHNEHDRMINVLKRFRKGIDMNLDCTEAISMLFHMALCGDPNGMNFDGLGNSGIMFTYNKKHYWDPSHAHLGAIAVYGPRGKDHAAMVMELNGNNPWMFSHGQEAGPLRVPYSVEAEAHGGLVTLLDIGHLL